MHVISIRLNKAQYKSCVGEFPRKTHLERVGMIPDQENKEYLKLFEVFIGCAFLASKSSSATHTRLLNTFSDRIANPRQSSQLKVSPRTGIIIIS